MSFKGQRGRQSSGLPLTAVAGTGGAQGLLSRLVALALVCLLCYTLLEAGLAAQWALSLKTTGSCQADNEGSWSIGIFRGPSPLELRPLECLQPRQDSQAAWPVANPVLTCASISDVPSNFVADPFLLQRGDKLYLFYETKAALHGKGQIGMAISADGGLSFQHQRVVLDTPWHLSYPFVFEHKGQVYMMPEASKSGHLTLYRATSFPTGWEEDRVAVPRPLIDASMVEWKGRWYLLGSDHTRSGAIPHGELEVWHANSPLGPWEPHAHNPVARGHRSAGFRNGGRLVVHDGRLLRFGQDCGATYGHRLVAYEITKLSPTEFEQRPVEHNISGLSGHRKTSWISERHHHIDAQQLPSGEWIAAIDGDSVPSGPISQRVIRTVVRIVLPWALVAGAWLAFNVNLVRRPAFRRWAVGNGIASASPLSPRGLSFKEARNSSASGRSAGGRSILGNLLFMLFMRLQVDMHQCAKALQHCWQSLQRRWLSTRLRRGLALVALLTAMTVAAAAYFFVAPYRQPAAPVAVSGQYSQFTLLCMSYEARMSTLRHFMRHYSRCPSVADIVVVWNKGKPPVPERDFDSAVRVRVRVERHNSLNNRFRQDPLIHTRAVMSLDDDIMLPCSDLERGFALWRAQPHRMVGFYPRLIEGQPLQFRGEWYAVEKGQYNAVLTGAAFLDSQTAFPAYWADAVKPARDMVDSVFNGEDLLMNFVLANASGSAAVEFIRPTRRVDISKLSGVGISHQWQHFLDATEQYLSAFAHTFGGVPLQRHTISWGRFRAPFFCGTGIGCTYL